MWRSTPSSRPAEPFRGFKVAQLILGDQDRGWLAGVTNRTFGVDVGAECGRAGCDPPGMDCRCGFHAFRDRAQAIAVLEHLTRRHSARSYVLLTVDLDGAVLEYELGFRAARQRVQRIEMPCWCIECLHHGLRRPARALVSAPSLRSEQVVVDGSAAARQALPYGSSPVRAVCARHEPRSSRRLDLHQLRAAIATEVTMLPEADASPGAPGS